MTKHEALAFDILFAVPLNDGVTMIKFHGCLNFLQIITSLIIFVTEALE